MGECHDPRGIDRSRFSGTVWESLVREAAGGRAPARRRGRRVGGHDKRTCGRSAERRSGDHGGGRHRLQPARPAVQRRRGQCDELQDDGDEQPDPRGLQRGQGTRIRRSAVRMRKLQRHHRLVCHHVGPLQGDDEAGTRQPRVRPDRLVRVSVSARRLRLFPILRRGSGGRRGWAERVLQLGTSAPGTWLS